jgi:hypothetical protein
MRLIAAIVAVMAVVPACSAASSGVAEVRASAVYDAIVRWFVQSNADDPVPLPVFIEPRGEGASIALDVQAELITSVKDVATVRFIDVRDEALVSNDAGALIVADGGILLRLAPVVEAGRKIRLDVDVHQHDQEFRTLQFDLSLVGGAWAIDQAPAEAPSG